MIYINLFFSFLYISFLFGCQSELPELTRAKELHDRGSKLEALQIYEDILLRYPENPASDKAKSALEGLYHEAAAIIRSSDPQAAYRLTKKQLELFPQGDFSTDAKKQIIALQTEADVYLAAQKKQKKMCTTAQQSPSALLWRVYLKEYPNGLCYREAREGLRDIEKSLCEKARAGQVRLWRTYLEDFPEGSCAEEAKSKSILNQLPEQEKLVVVPLLKECKRLAEKCPKLNERYQSLVQQKELKYLRGSYYAYLNKWLDAYDIAGDSLNAKLASFEQQGLDVASARTEYQIACVEACALNQKIRIEIRDCTQQNFGKNTFQNIRMGPAFLLQSHSC
jgi:hypothetical protein